MQPEPETITYRVVADRLSAHDNSVQFPTRALAQAWLEKLEQRWAYSDTNQRPRFEIIEVEVIE